MLTQAGAGHIGVEKLFNGEAERRQKGVLGAALPGITAGDLTAPRADHMVKQPEGGATLPRHTSRMRMGAVVIVLENHSCQLAMFPEKKSWVKV